MRPQNRAQGRMKKVSRRVVSHRIGAVLRIDTSRDVVPYFDVAFDETAAMHNQLLGHTLSVLDDDAAVGAADLAVVADLATGFRIERGFREEDFDLRVL